MRRLIALVLSCILGASPAFAAVESVPVDVGQEAVTPSRGIAAPAPIIDTGSDPLFPLRGLNGARAELQADAPQAEPAGAQAPQISAADLEASAVAPSVEASEASNEVAASKNIL